MFLVSLVLASSSPSCAIRQLLMHVYASGSKACAAEHLTVFYGRRGRPVQKPRVMPAALAHQLALKLQARRVSSSLGLFPGLPNQVGRLLKWPQPQAPLRMAKQRNSATAPRCWALMRCLGMLPAISSLKSSLVEPLSGETPQEKQAVHGVIVVQVNPAPAQPGDPAL